MPAPPLSLRPHALPLPHVRNVSPTATKRGVLLLIGRSCSGSTPECPQRIRDSFRLDPMRWVEVVTILEHVELEVREDPG